MRFSVALLCLSSLLIIGCQKKQENPPASVSSLRINIENEPTSLDPRKGRNLNDLTICRMLFEGLTRIGRDGKPELAVADAVAISENRLTYVFHLKKTYWSNGDPVTSYDFAESWKTILSPQFPTDIAYQLYCIENAKKVKSGELPVEKLGIQTPDPMTLIVKLEVPTPYFLEVCATPSFFPVPRNIAANDPQWFSNPQTFVGNGAFSLKSWNHKDHILVVRNGDYWDAPSVHLQEIELMMVSNDTELQMFEENELDWAGSPLSTMPVDAVQHLKQTNQLRVSPLSGTYFLRVNTSETIHGKPNPLSSADLRRAVAKGIDREAITTHILQGGQTPARSLVPPEMGLYGNGYFAEDRKTIAKTDGEAITITFVADNRNYLIAQTLQKQLEPSLGRTFLLEPVEAKIFYQRIREKNYQLAIGSWIADFNDPVNFLEVFKYKTSSTNNTCWEDSKYIDLLDRSAVCGDSDERMQLLRQAEEILMDQMPIVPIFHFAMNYLERDGVKGVALSPIGQIDFRWAYLEDAQPSRSHTR